VNPNYEASSKAVLFLCYTGQKEDLSYNSIEKQDISAEI